MSTITETDHVIFDDDMSWTDDVSQIARVQEEIKDFQTFIESGRFEQFMNHGLFANEHVNKVYEIGLFSGLSLMPALAGTLEDMKTKEFHDLLEECELYCEKMRRHEAVCLYVFLMNDPYEKWDHKCEYPYGFWEQHYSVKRDCISFDIFRSPHVGEWEFDIDIFKNERPVGEKDKFPSLVDCIDGLVDALEKEYVLW